MIIARELLSQLCTGLRSSGKKVVFTNGCFDILHSGHCIYLAKAAKLGDYLVVGINSDDSVRRLKGIGRPINAQSERACVLDSLRFVDFVTIFDEDTPHELISELKPALLVKGGDYDRQSIVGADLVESNGGTVVTIPLVEGKSTSSIIEKLKS